MKYLKINLKIMCKTLEEKFNWKWIKNECDKGKLPEENPKESCSDPGLGQVSQTTRNMNYKITDRLKCFTLQKPSCITRIVLAWRGSMQEFILVIKQFCIFIVVVMVPQIYISHKITYNCTQIYTYIHI